MPLIIGHKAIYGHPSKSLEDGHKATFLMGETSGGCFIPLKGSSKWYPNEVLKWMGQQKVTLPDGKVIPQFFLLGLPDCVRFDNGSSDNHFGDKDLFARAYPGVALWKEKVTSFFCSTFSGNKADAKSIENAVYRFSTLAIVAIPPSNEPLYLAYPTKGKYVPHDALEQYEIISAVTFAMATPCMAHIVVS